MVAVEIAPHEYSLSKTSYVDTTVLQVFPDDRAHVAFADLTCHRASISPSLRARIISAANSHQVLTDAQRALFV